MAKINVTLVRAFLSRTSYRCLSTLLCDR